MTLTSSPTSVRTLPLRVAMHARLDRRLPVHALVDVEAQRLEVAEVLLHRRERRRGIERQPQQRERRDGRGAAAASQPRLRAL